MKVLLTGGKGMLGRTLVRELGDAFEVVPTDLPEGDITDENVIEVLNKALPIHEANRVEEIFLKKYERGQQPILHRTKLL